MTNLVVFLILLFIISYKSVEKEYNRYMQTKKTDITNMEIAEITFDNFLHKYSISSENWYLFSTMPVYCVGGMMKYNITFPTFADYRKYKKWKSRMDIVKVTSSKKRVTEEFEGAWSEWLMQPDSKT